MKKHRNLHPLEAEQAPFTPHWGWVLGSLLLAFWTTLLPWRVQYPAAPNLLLVMLVFWCLHQQKGVGMLLAFVLGLLTDAHDGTLLGQHAMGYVLTLYVVKLMREHLQAFSIGAHWVALSPVLWLATTPSHLFEVWLEGQWVGWHWLWSGLWSSLCFAVVLGLYALVQHGREDVAHV